VPVCANTKVLFKSKVVKKQPTISGIACQKFIPIGDKYMYKSGIALLVMMPCIFAHGDENNCKEVSGGAVTNFLTESETVNFANESGIQFIYTILGTVTGNLAGALGVVAKVHHHWVTDAGDTIYLQDATANAFHPYSGVYAVADDSYTVNIIGGTGRFAAPAGQLSTIVVLDKNQGKVVLRYQGPICFARPNSKMAEGICLRKVPDLSFATSWTNLTRRLSRF
jgi:hypothetical protein